MEDLFSLLIVIIGIVASLTSAAKKAQARKAAEATSWPSAADQPKAAEKKVAHPYKPVQAMMPPMSVADAPGQVIAPTVHAHIQPDCETHDKPGSLGVTSMEGKDPCHEAELTLERTFAEPVQPEGGLTFDWSGQNMVKAFVMQEVLTRPCQRQAR